MRALLDSGKVSVSEATPFLKNTPLHLAVRGQQLETIKCLIYDYDADPTIENALGKNSLMLANGLRDEPVKNVMMGLLNRIHTSTKVVRNMDARKEKEELRIRNKEEIQRLRTELRAKIEERGLDLAKVFKMFDKNGDGVFNHMEFECAFVALDIQITKADLRRFISLTDTNKDGRVDFNEFYTMLSEDIN